MPLEQLASVNGYADIDYLLSLKDKIEAYEKTSKYLSLVDLKQGVDRFIFLNKKKPGLVAGLFAFRKLFMLKIKYSYLRILWVCLAAIRKILSFA